MIISEEVLWNCGRLGDVGWFVDWSAVLVKTVFESSFGFSNVSFEVTIALYHVDDIFRIANDVMRNMSCFALAWNV